MKREERTDREGRQRDREQERTEREKGGPVL